VSSPTHIFVRCFMMLRWLAEFFISFSHDAFLMFHEDRRPEALSTLMILRILTRVLVFKVSETCQISNISNMCLVYALDFSFSSWMKKKIMYLIAILCFVCLFSFFCCRYCLFYFFFVSARIFACRAAQQIYSLRRS